MRKVFKISIDVFLLMLHFFNKVVFGAKKFKFSFQMKKKEHFMYTLVFAAKKVVFYQF